MFLFFLRAFIIILRKFLIKLGHPVILPRFWEILPSEIPRGNKCHELEIHIGFLETNAYNKFIIILSIIYQDENKNVDIIR